MSYWLDEAFGEVADFHRAFGHPIGSRPAHLPRHRVVARMSWMTEELEELDRATDVVEQADALIDLIYFALGTFVELGVKPGELFEVVHQANMSKLWPDGKPRYKVDGKVIKPGGWIDPVTDPKANTGDYKDDCASPDDLQMLKWY